jgi:signal peptide peptidase SppA
MSAEIKPIGHRIDRVISTVYGTPWAITEAKLNDVLAVLDRRRDGLLTAHEQTLAAAIDQGGDGEDDCYQTTAAGVAILSLSGIISQRMNLMMRFSGGTSTEQFGALFQKALKDPAVKAIVLDVNSPGGSIGGVAELANQIFAARGEKPIVAVANTQMASAAYWIASAASEIAASPSASVGSIGVYMVHAEKSRADAAAGIGRSIISAGKYKTAGNDVEPLTAESRGRLQQYVQAAYELFTESVARNRKTTVASVQGGFGEGDVLMARDAVAAKLADRVATLQEVVDQLETKIKAESGGPRAVSAAPIPSLSLTLGVPRMEPKLKAALFARGLLSALDASDETAEAVLTALYAGRNEPKPTDAAKLLADVMAPQATKAAITEPIKLAEAGETNQQALTRGQVDERHRQSCIRASCELLGLSGSEIDGLVALNLPADKTISVNAKALLAAQNEPLPRLMPVDSSTDKFAAVAQEALDARCLAASGGQAGATALQNVSAPARELLGTSMMELAVRSLDLNGVRTRGMSRGQIATLALQGSPGVIMATGAGASFYGTGTFSNLVLNASHKTLTRGFLEAPVTWRQWVRQGESVADFKVQNLVKFGEASDLELKPEGHDTPTDSGLLDDREYFQVETYAKIIPLSRELILNDDLSAISRLPRMQGVAAARTFNRLVYSLLTSNPLMADGYALFDATYHQANLLSGTTESPSVASLNKIQAALRKMKGLSTQATLNLSLRWLIVPAALEATALTLLRSATDPALTNANVKNIFYGLIDPIVEPLLDANSAAYFYGAADNGVIDTISVRFLQGEETPVMTSWWDPDKDVRQMKVRQTGAAVLEEYRGLVRDNGT